MVRHRGRDERLELEMIAFQRSVVAFSQDHSVIGATQLGPVQAVAQLLRAYAAWERATPPETLRRQERPTFWDRVSLLIDEAETVVRLLAYEARAPADVRAKYERVREVFTRSIATFCTRDEERLLASQADRAHAQGRARRPAAKQAASVLAEVDAMLAPRPRSASATTRPRVAKLPIIAGA